MACALSCRFVVCHFIRADNCTLSRISFVYLRFRMLFTFIFNLYSGLWLPGPAPILEEEAVLKLNSNTKISETERQLDFTIFGESHFILFIFCGVFIRVNFLN